MKLIVGLGNPGNQYSRTRHNIGFRVVDALAEQLDVSFSKKQFKGLYGSGRLPETPKNSDENDDRVILVKPQTYMNGSGETVQGFSGYYKISPQDILIVVDEVALPIGILRIRTSGSAGGHNGIKDILRAMGQNGIPRLRVGVGEKPNDEDGPSSGLTDHVLGKFRSEEEEQLPKIIKQSVEACLCWAIQGSEKAMNTFNAVPKEKSKKEKPKQENENKSENSE